MIINIICNSFRENRTLLLKKYGISKTELNRFVNEFENSAENVNEDEGKSPEQIDKEQQLKDSESNVLHKTIDRLNASMAFKTEQAKLEELQESKIKHGDKESPRERNKINQHNADVQKRIDEQQKKVNEAKMNLENARKEEDAAKETHKGLKEDYKNEFGKDYEESPAMGQTIKDLEEKITEKTKAIIVNSPNNPSGVVYSEETIKALRVCSTEGGTCEGCPLHDEHAEEPFGGCSPEKTSFSSETHMLLIPRQEKAYAPM